MKELAQRLNQLLSHPDALKFNGEKLVTVCHQLIEKYEIQKAALTHEENNFNDELRPLLSTIKGILPNELDLLLLKTLKLLLRKPCNRLSLSKFGIGYIVAVLNNQTRSKPLQAAEVCSIILNACYEASNVRLFLEEGGLSRVLQFLGNSGINSTDPVSIAIDPRLLASALGALQGICFIPIGRQYILAENDGSAIFLVAKHLRY